MHPVKTIGQNIVNARKSENLTQLQLSEYMAISPQAIGKWERGESLPDLIQIQKLAKIFGVEIGNLISEDLTFLTEKESKGKSIK